MKEFESVVEESAHRSTLFAVYPGRVDLQAYSIIGRMMSVPRRRFLALVAVLSAVAVLVANTQRGGLGGGLGGRRVELDSLNPFGSVQDVQLPDALGQPPTLTHLYHTSFGPGFSETGRPENSHGPPTSRAWGQPVAASSLSYIGPVTVGPIGAHLASGDADPAGYESERQRAGADQPGPFYVQPSIAHAVPDVQGRPAWALEAEARSHYWRSLDDFYAAEAYADYAKWLMQRRQMAGTQKGQQVLMESEEGALGDRTAAKRNFEASRSLVHALHEGASWEQLQDAWGYFYSANKELDAKQEAINQHRAELLAQVSSPSAPDKGVHVSSYVQPWQPFAKCRPVSGEDGASASTSFMCMMAAGIDTPKSDVGFTPSPADAGQKLAGGQEEESGLQKALDPLNDEQARLNRARMLLYVREFGALKEMLASPASGLKVAGKDGTSTLPYFPGDFEMPRVTDCNDPGHCHDWANGQYIDNFAGATTNWDLIGSHQGGNLHWDSLPGDAWTGGPGVMPDGGEVRWKQSSPARTSQLVQVSGASSGGFDWNAFNAKQEVLAQRAQSAANLLLSPRLQQQPVTRLLVQADPSLEAQLEAAENLHTKRQAVGGMGTWTETHDPTADPKSSGGFVIPPGMPFGGGGASRSLGDQKDDSGGDNSFKMPDWRGGGASRPIGGAVAKRQALQRQLHRVEHLMNRQWGKASVDSEMNRSLQNRRQRVTAERAARESERVLQAALGMSTRGGSDEERSLVRPAERQREEKAKQGAQQAVDDALVATEESEGDDPESAKEREKMYAKVQAAMKTLAHLALQEHPSDLATPVVHAATATAAYPAAGRGDDDVLEAKLSAEQKENRKLRERLAALSSHRKGLEAEEAKIAAEVARKLAPSVVKQAAQAVAGAVQARAAMGTRLGRMRRVHGATRLSAAVHTDHSPVRHKYSTVYRGTDKHWKPHYFNGRFWSKLSQYFAGGSPGDGCTECVGDFMTAAHDIRLSSGASDQANPKVVPLLCQEVCKHGGHLHMQFPRGHNKDTYGGGHDLVRGEDSAQVEHDLVLSASR